VLLADRHHGLVEGIRRLLDTAFDVVLMVADANSLFEGAERLQPTLAVVDLCLSPNDGLDLLRKLRVRCGSLKIIALSMHGEPAIVRSALNAGADGYVLKSAIGTDLLSAVDNVLAGRLFVSPAIPFEMPGKKTGNSSP
jgi:DNA-binding NarL/FixJ family response regulator